MKISLPFITSARLPRSLFLFVTSAISACAGFIKVSPGQSAPLEETRTTFPIPKRCISLQMEIPAAPAPLMTALQSSHFRPVSLNALISPAHTTTAVPCWSSWNTGISSSSFSLRSISKQRGAAMSSRLIPPKEGAILFTVSMISSVSFVSRQMGNASTFAKRLNKTDLPSITGIAARGPISPSPRTAVPSETTATVLALQV